MYSALLALFVSNCFSLCASWRYVPRTSAKTTNKQEIPKLSRPVESLADLLLMMTHIAPRRKTHSSLFRFGDGSLRSGTVGMYADGDVPSLPEADGYTTGRLSSAIPAYWRQSGRIFQLIFELPEGISVREHVRLGLYTNKISLNIDDTCIIDGQLRSSIDVDESDWYVEDELEGFQGDARYLIVDLCKQRSNMNWNGPLLLEGNCIAQGGLSVRHLTPAELRELDTSDMMVAEDFISPETVTALKNDHMALRATGTGASSSLREELDTSFRNSHTIGLGKNGLWPERKIHADVASWLAAEFLPFIKAQLAPVASLKTNASRSGPIAEFSDRVELAYLHYPPGGYFKPHIDAYQVYPPGYTTRRAFSFVLFLHDLDESEGGTLHLYQPLTQAQQLQRARGENFNLERKRVRSVSPRAGRFVAFRSQTVLHEVAENFADRWVLVGWLHRPISPNDVPDARGCMNTSRAQAHRIDIGR